MRRRGRRHRVPGQDGPIQGVTLVAYSGHAFTDQVTGFGHSMKRGVGRHMMTEKLEALFAAGRTKVTQ